MINVLLLMPRFTFRCFLRPRQTHPPEPAQKIPAGEVCIQQYLVVAVAADGSAEVCKTVYFKQKVTEYVGVT